MNRLYGAKLNTNEWIINEIDNKNYHTYHSITNLIFYFS